MKIAINTRFLLKDKLEGIGRVTYELVKRLVLQHPEHQFYFFFDRPFDASFVFADNVYPVVLYPPARHPFLWYLWFEWAIPRAIRKYRPDLFLSPDNYLSLSTPVKTLLITHDLAHVHYPDEIPYFTRKFYDYYVPRYVRRADHIIAVSNFTKQDIIKQYKVPPEKISVVYNACDNVFASQDDETKQKAREKYAGGKDYFFYVGSIHPRKNIIRLIQAFEKFKNKTQSAIKLLLGGRFAWQSGSIRETLEKSKFSRDIHFLGYLEEEELPRVIAAARALVYVSLFEGFGLPILEAMHCETPVITSGVTSMPEVAGDAALIIDPASETAIAEAMEKIQNPQFARELINKGKKQREKFNWDRSAEQVYQIIEKLVRE